jgi:hypothetical protein
MPYYVLFNAFFKDVFVIKFKSRIDRIINCQCIPLILVIMFAINTKKQIDWYLIFYGLNIRNYFSKSV